MNNCYIKFGGGLGNQLFQLAAAYSYCKKYDKNLFIDTSVWGASQGKPPSEYSKSIFKNFNYKNEDEPVSRIHEQRFNYDEFPFYEGSVAIHGYFQSIKYFKEVKDEFIEKLNLYEINTNLNLDNSIMFHIRRGDYMRFPIHYVCDTDYFKKLFDQYKNYEIHVFTDSPTHVLEEFKNENFKLINTKSELTDLILMSKYKRMVCSNSSFAWWSAHLGDKKELIVVPDKWILDRDCSDIYTDNMTIIKTGK